MHGNPEDAIERAMVTIRRRQSRRAVAEDVRRQGFSATLIANAEILDDIAEAIAVGGSPTVTNIAERLRMDQPRASRLVADAIANGLLERVADQSDGRRSPLRLTAQGESVLAGIRSNRRFLYEQAMADWAPDERSTFAGLLTRFVAALE